MIVSKKEEVAFFSFPFDDESRSLLNILSASNSTSSRYDRFITGPSSEEGRIIWVVWSIIAGIVGLSCLILILSILTSKIARKNPFNMYITFLTIPDFVFSANCAISCGINAYYGHYVSATMCEWQSWYCIFGFTGNSWLNGIIAMELYKLLCDSKKGFRYKPPSLNKVYIQATIIYIYSSFVAAWTLFSPILGLPHKANAGAGLACLPIEYSLGSTLFFWFVFFPAFFGIPFGYVLYVCWNVYKQNLLPRSGKTRQLFFFFFRLTCVFIFFWIPSFILMFITGNPNIWYPAIGGAWSHLQGLASVVFCLTKPGIRKRVLNFLCCKCKDNNTEAMEREDSTMWSSFATRFSMRTSTLLRRSSQLFSREFSTREFTTNTRLSHSRIFRRSSELFSKELFVDDVDDNNNDQLGASVEESYPTGRRRKSAVSFDISEEDSSDVREHDDDDGSDSSVVLREYQIKLNDIESNESDDDDNDDHKDYDDIESLTMDSTTEERD